MAWLARIDPSWGGRVVYENPSSRFQPAGGPVPRPGPGLRRRRAGDHPLPGALQRLGLLADGARYLDRDDWGRMVIPRRAGRVRPRLLRLPLCGKDGEGYGVAAARNPNGPVAVIGSHGECFGAMVKLAAEGLPPASGSDRPRRLGESFLRPKQGLAPRKIDGFTFRLLDAVDGNPSIPQAVQRQDRGDVRPARRPGAAAVVAAAGRQADGRRPRGTRRAAGPAGGRRRRGWKGRRWS